MKSDNALPNASPDGFLIPRVLACIPIVCFTGALLTDLAYARTADIMWADFSDWLLAAGEAGGGLACLAAIVVWLTGRRPSSRRAGWIVTLGSLLTLAIGLGNNLVHSRDAWTSVVPEGVVLSALTVIVMLVTAWFAASVRTRRVVAPSYSGVRA